MNYNLKNLSWKQETVYSMKLLLEAIKHNASEWYHHVAEFSLRGIKHLLLSVFKRQGFNRII